MPASSKAQFKFLQMLAHNPEKAKKKGSKMRPEAAKEYVSHNTGKMAYSKLPEKK